MVSITFVEELDDKLGEMLSVEFSRYAAKNNVVCNYTPFNFIAKEEDEIVGILTGHSYCKEVHISDIIVLENYRNKQIGSKLIKAVEDFHKDKGFENINLSTYAFQAPGFYRKLGFEIEYIRENTNDPKLTKYFLIKFFVS